MRSRRDTLQILRDLGAPLDPEDLRREGLDVPENDEAPDGPA